MTSLSRIAAALSDTPEGGGYPVENWHPEREGEIDIVIRRDGRWIHEGGEIERPSLVRLFSKVLRRDGDAYVLVTPAEKLSLTVEDVPFVLTALDREGDTLYGRTNVGDRVALGDAHPIEMRAGADGADIPYLHVRGGLWARFARAVYYRMVEDEAVIEGDRVKVRSASATFDLGSAE